MRRKPYKERSTFGLRFRGFRPQTLVPAALGSCGTKFMMGEHGEKKHADLMANGMQREKGQVPGSKHLLKGHAPNDLTSFDSL